MSPARASVGRDSGTIGTSRSTAAGINASRPRPNAFLTTFQHLPRQIQIAHRPHAMGIVYDDWFAKARSLAQANVPRYDRSVDALREEAARLLQHLLRQVQTVVEHGEEDPFDLEI